MPSDLWPQGDLRPLVCDEQGANVTPEPLVYENLQAKDPANLVTNGSMGLKLEPSVPEDQHLKKVVDVMSASFDNVAARTIEQIDNLITRLTNLKRRVELENSDVKQRMTKFVVIADTSLSETGRLDGLVHKVEKALSDFVNRDPEAEE